MPRAHALVVARTLDHEWLNAIAKIDHGQRYYTPASDRTSNAIRPAVTELVTDERRFLAAFDRFEYLLAMRFAVEPDPFGSRWLPLGSFGWRGHRAIVGGGLPDEIAREIEAAKDAWPPVTAGVFESADEARRGQEAVVARLQRGEWG